jgi:type IV secretory pathway protease TraF
MLPTFSDRPTWRTGEVLTKENLRTVSKGEIISFVCVKQNGHPVFACKRAMGLAGDVVEDIKGTRMIVPAGHIWVLGDNPPESYDSRRFGAVPLSNLRFRYDL